MTTDSPTLTRSQAGLELISPAFAQSFVLPAGTTTIGAGPKCDLRLDSPGVRPLHCVVVSDDSGVTVRRWAAGAKLNGKAFTESPLQQGDCLSIGAIELRVSPAHEAQAPEEPEDEFSCQAAAPLWDTAPALLAEPQPAAAPAPEAKPEPQRAAVDETLFAKPPEENFTERPVPALNPIPAHLLKPWNAVHKPDMAPEETAPAMEALSDTPAEPAADRGESSGASNCLPTGIAGQSVSLVETDPAEEAVAPDEFQYYTDVDWSVGVGEGCHNPATPVTPPEIKQPPAEAQSVAMAAEHEAAAPRPAAGRARVRSVIAAFRAERETTSCLRAEVEQLAAERAAIEERLSRVEAELADSNQARSDLDTQNRSVETELAGLRESNQQLQTTLSELKPRLEELATTVAKLEEQKACWYAERAELNDRLEEALAQAAQPAPVATATEPSEEDAPPAGLTGAADKQPTDLSSVDSAAEEPSESQAHQDLGPAPEPETDFFADAEEPVWNFKTEWKQEGATAAPSIETPPPAASEVVDAPTDWTAAWDSSGGSVAESEEQTQPEPPAASPHVSPNADALWGDVASEAAPVHDPQEAGLASDATPGENLWSFNPPESEAAGAPPCPTAAAQAACEPEAAVLASELPSEPAGATARESEAATTEQAPDSAELDNGQSGYWIDSFADGAGFTDSLGHGATEVEEPQPEPEHSAFQQPKSFYEQYAHLLEEDAQQSPEPQPAPQPAPPTHVQPSSSAEEDDDIDAYMAQLMERMRGGEPAGAPAPAPKPSAAPMASAPAPELASAMEAPVTAPPKPAPLMSLDEIKKSAAPERGADLDSLRMLANQSARQAIGVAASKQNKERSVTNFIIACIALASGGFLMASASEVMSLQMLGGTVALSGSGVWVVRSLKHLLEALRTDRGKEHPAPAKNASEALPIVKDQA
ncbi:MAG: FHA domain-containing protein [Planctomycetales bacterium]|nr:FHA domain-containing protein [Planctomycetales bacterium]